MRSIEEEMAHADPDKLESLMKTYDRLQQTFKDKGGYQYEADVRSVIHGLGFAGHGDSARAGFKRRTKNEARTRKNAFDKA